jgi:hypothetical protein
MKIIGFSSGGIGHEGNTDRIVQAIMAESGHEYEFVKLSDLRYSGCKGCVQLCAQPQVCLYEDDLLPYYQKIKEADAVVIGSPVYFRNINGDCNSFIERFFGYRHVDSAVKGKPFIAVVCGHDSIEGGAEYMQWFLQRFGVKLLDTVRYVSQSPPCLSCGRHYECRIGGLYRVRGEAALTLVIEPEHFRRWEDDPLTMEAVAAAAEKLRNLETIE